MPLDEDLASIQAILTRYVLTICMGLGIIGSLLNLTVFSQRKFQSNSCSVYFMATSIFNLLVILCGITPELLTYYGSYDLTSYSPAFCKAKSYLVHAFLMMSRSSVTLACIDRFALCSRTVRIRRLNQRSIAILLSVIACIIWLILPIHILFYVDIQIPRRTCTGAGVYLIIYSTYTAIVTLIPLILMIIFSIFVIKSLKLTSTRMHLRRVNIRSNSTNRVQKRDIQLITILLSEVIVYYISTVWYPIYSIYMAITWNDIKTPNRFAIEGFIRYLALSFFIFLNSCSLFYVNLLASRGFRYECKQLILSWLKCDKANRSSTTTSESSNMTKQLIRRPENSTLVGLSSTKQLNKI